jgi:hypothetical protein
MGKFNEWLGKKQPEKEYEWGYGKDIPEKNAEGGFDPQTQQQLKVFKKVDLITLPVEGTNCGNCMFIKNVDKNGVGFCTHKDVQEWVTKKMCCALWSHPQVKRQWNVK